MLYEPRINYRFLQNLRINRGVRPQNEFQTPVSQINDNCHAIIILVCLLTGSPDNNVAFQIVSIWDKETLLETVIIYMAAFSFL